MFLVLWLFFVLLNGKLTLEIALIGIVVAAVAVAIAHFLVGYDIKREWKHTKMLPRFAAYGLLMVWEIFKANLCVMKRIYSRKRVEPEIREIPRSFESEWQTALMANSITLTPGTITLRLDDDKLTVHCLDTEFADGLEGTSFERAIEKMGEKSK